MRKIVAFVLVMLFFTGALSAGGQGEEGVSAVPAFDPDKEYTISIGGYGDLERAYSMVFSTPHFKELYPNITIEFQTSDFGGHHNRLTTVIAAGEATNAIEALEIGFIAQFVEGGGLTDLSTAPYNGFEAGKEIVPFAMSNATTQDGRLVAMPVDIAPAILFYRKDLIEAAGISEEQIQNLRNWDEFIEIGKKLTIDKDGDGKIDQWAIPHANDVAMVPLNGGKGGWFDENGSVLQPKTRFMDVLNLVKSVRDAGIDADFGAWSGPWIQSFSDGTVALMVNGAWFGGALKTWMAPDIKDWRVAYLPGKIPAALGGSYLSIPETVPAEQKAVAWEIIKFLTTDPYAQLVTFVEIDAYPALTTVFDDPIMIQGVDYFGGEKVRLIYADVAESMPTAEVSEYDAVILGIWNNAVTSVIIGEMGVDEGYDTALNQIQASID
jgi:multiple sugar transport system substrate-binding protein